MSRQAGASALNPTAADGVRLCFDSIVAHSDSSWNRAPSAGACTFSGKALALLAAWDGLYACGPVGSS